MQGGDQLNLPARFRFHPTDEELVSHYLCRKCADQHISAPIIAEIDLYKFDPWDLPAMALYGEKEWYFFSPRDRKYPNGSRPNRMAGTGYWKATGADKPVGKPKTLGIKKALVFYAGKAPRGVKTNWIMHEYRLANVDRSAGIGKRNNLRLDDWVLCRLYNKKGTIEKHYNVDESEVQQFWDSEEQKPNLAAALSHKRMNGTFYLSDSVPKMMQTESSSWEHVSSSSPDKEEVQRTSSIIFLIFSSITRMLLRAPKCSTTMTPSLFYRTCTDICRGLINWNACYELPRIRFMVSQNE